LFWHIFRKDFSTTLKCAKISSCRFRDERHAFVSHLVMIGVGLIAVKELLGHKSIKMKAIESVGNVIATNKAPNGEIVQLEKALNAVNF
jgi:integrase